MRRSSRRKVKKISHNIFATVTDLVLFQTFLALEYGFSGRGRSPGAVWKACYEANRELEEINYETLRNAFNILKRKGLVRIIEEEAFYKPQITKAGRKRLESFIPDYDDERVWDGRLYLVTYDVPEERKGDRDALRNYLKKIGCGMLQRSVFLTPYNPKGVLEDFIEETGLRASVIISDVGEDGSIGENDIKTLVREVYHLDELNDEYRNFISEFKNTKKGTTEPLKVGFAFIEILEKDPQLPFELLPDDWTGEKAYEISKKSPSNVPLNQATNHTLW